MTGEPAYVQATLDWCNQRRAEFKRRPLKRLPRGLRCDPTSCPCGKASGWVVTGDEAERWDADGGWTTIRTPAAVRRFVVAFDDGKLPQYEVKA